MKYAALLRGINVGGKNKIAMKDLTELFVSVGCRDVVTYIQSGNVVFSATAAALKKLPKTISERIAADFGLNVPVVIRSHEELDAMVRANPFFKSGDEKLLHVVFLADSPGTDAIAKLDPRRSPPDQFRVAGNHIYLHMPNGMGQTKITNAWLDSKLSTISTARNWATVLKLHELTRP
jgi:uncharacterized protein (DUF1697 family)